jgi:hypothetical protein
MRPNMLCSGAGFLVVAFHLLSAPSLASAQAEDDPDLKAYSSYQLTMPKYRKYLAAMVNMAQAAEHNPAVGRAFEGSGEQSIDQTVAAFNRVPEMRRAISGAGLTTRDFVLTQGTFLQTGLAYGLMKQAGLSPDSVVKTTQVSRSNLEFYRKNEVEMNRLYKEAEAKAPALKRADEENGAEADSGEPSGAN